MTKLASLQEERDTLAAKIDLYSLGDRPSSPPVRMLRQLFVLDRLIQEQKNQVERVIVAKFAGRCRLCLRPFKPGERIIWSPTFGTRCEEPNDVGEQICMSQFEGDEDLFL